MDKLIDVTEYKIAHFTSKRKNRVLGIAQSINEIWTIDIDISPNDWVNRSFVDNFIHDKKQRN